MRLGHALVLWAALAGALGGAGCGAPAHRPARPGSPAPRVTREAAATPADPPRPAFAARLAARRAAHGDAIVGDASLEGPRALHLVLEAGRCYAIEAVTDAEARLVVTDEHGHEVAAAEGEDPRAGRVCPRWTSSFTLAVEVSGSAGVLIVGE